MTELAKVLRAPRAEPELDLEDDNCEADQQSDQEERYRHMRMDVEDGGDPSAADAINMDLELDQINDNLQDLAEDNLSLEVQFGDGSSCRASDVSSLSFQNIVFDDNDTPPEAMRSRRDSEDSNDSYPNDFPEADTQAFSGQLEKFRRQKRYTNDRNSDTSSPTVDDIGDVDEPMAEHDTGTMKRRSKILDVEPESERSSEHAGATTESGHISQQEEPTRSSEQEDNKPNEADSRSSSQPHSSINTHSSHLTSSSQHTAEASSSNTQTHSQQSTASHSTQHSSTTTTQSSSSSSSSSTSTAQTSSQDKPSQHASAAAHSQQEACTERAHSQQQKQTDCVDTTGCDASALPDHRGQSRKNNNSSADTQLFPSASVSVSSVPVTVSAGNSGVSSQPGDGAVFTTLSSSSSSSFPPPVTGESHQRQCHGDIVNGDRVDDGMDGATARNSLEIRNNIPVYRQAKDCHHDTATVNTVTSAVTQRQHPHHHHYHHQQGGMPKIKKISPGLARRLGDTDTDQSDFMDRDTSSSEKETHPQLDYTVKSGHAQMRDKLENGLNPQPHPTETDHREDGHSALTVGQDPDGGKKAYDIENEYDYVKWTRVQEGDSYVGMRLAYSSSNDSLSYNKHKWATGAGSDDGHYLGSSRESSPEKILHQRINEQNPHASSVNEDTLTEIPLNGMETGSGEEKKNFSLSPETTECDSAEVESVLSDEGKSSTSGMPMVEDGLSSSQCSDIDEAFATHDPRRPAEILKRRHKNEVEQGITTNGFEVMGQRVQHETMSQSPLSSPSASDVCQNTTSREALDLAIQDIKSAIKRSKSATLKSPYQEDQAATEEPIWIMRDAYMRKQERQDEMRRVREEIERQQEEEYIQQEQEKVTDLENDEDELLKFQFSRNSGKEYQPGKGYESDDELDDHDRQQQLSKKSSRWNKGRTYAAISTDDVTDHNYLRNDARMKYTSRYPGNFNMHSRYTSKSESALNRDPSSQHSTPTQQNHHSNTSHNSSTSQISKAAMPNSYSTSRGYSSEDSDEKESERRPQTYSKTPHPHEGDYDTDEETDQLLNRQYTQSEKIDIPELTRPPVNRSAQAEKRRSRAKEVILPDPDNETVLIEGVLFRARYLGSTQLISEGQPSKAMRMMQAQEAVGRIKAPEGENQPSTEVDLFVSTEKIMVLNTDLQEIMMDHSLRTISYIADIGDIVVIMARRRNLTNPAEDLLHRRKQTKMLCHVFESDEAQLIAQSIGQAFSVAYMEFLKANGIEDLGLVKEMDYQEVLNQQEIFGEELFLFSNKDMTKEVIVPKLKGDPLGVVIVESGWGSMVPTVVLANMSPTGAAARCGQLNIGDQIMSVNGVSLVGLPLSSCQNYIKATRNQTVVKLSVVSCAPVVEVCIKRPDVKYQLGFSVQNGVICSLLRGGIAERGGVRVGHRIIEINNNSVVAVQHEKIVNMLATSVGEIHMKTMPTSIYRLLTGQETPHYM